MGNKIIPGKSITAVPNPSTGINKTQAQKLDEKEILSVNIYDMKEQLICL